MWETWEEESGRGSRDGNARTAGRTGLGRVIQQIVEGVGGGGQKWAWMVTRVGGRPKTTTHTVGCLAIVAGDWRQPGEGGKMARMGRHANVQNSISTHKYWVRAGRWCLQDRRTAGSEEAPRIKEPCSLSV